MKQIHNDRLNWTAPHISTEGVRRLARFKPVRFMVVGVANTTFGLTVIYTLAAFGASPIVANATAYFFGLILSFILNKQWTFGHSGDVIASATRFLVVFAIAYSCNLAVVVAAIRLLRLNHQLAQALGIPPFTLVLYLGANAFALRQSAETDRFGS